MKSKPENKQEEPSVNPEEFLAAIPVKQQALQSQANAFFPIKSQAGYQAASEFASAHLLKFADEIDTVFERTIDNFTASEKLAKKGKKEAIEDRDRLKAPVLQLVAMFSQNLAAWQDEQERLTLESLKLVHGAGKAIGAALVEEEQDSKYKRAVRLIEQGREEEAAQLIDSIDSEPQDVVELTDQDFEVLAAGSRPRAKGSRSTVSFVPVLLDETKVTREFCKPDWSKIKAYVKANGRAAEKIIGGIRVEKDRKVGFTRTKTQITDSEE